MKKNEENVFVFSGYLNDIDISRVLLNRVIEIYNFYRDICPETIQDIFITDTIGQDGERIYENLWFFSKSHMMESKNFITKDDFDFSSFKDKGYRWEIVKTSYDFNTSTEKSRLYIRFFTSILSMNVYADLKASKNNCDYLRDIFRKYFAPNIAV